MLTAHIDVRADLQDYLQEPALAKVRRRLTNKLGWTGERLDAAERQFFEYFFTASPDDEPDVDVDEYWHQFILHTKEYMEFCQKYLGYYLHHNVCEGTRRCDCKRD
jgi:hypothetical protein